MDQVYVCDLWKVCANFYHHEFEKLEASQWAPCYSEGFHNPPPKILLKKFWWSGGEQKQKRRRPMEYWRVWWWVCLIKANLRSILKEINIQESSAANEYKHSFHPASSAPVIRPAVDNPSHSKLVLCTRFPFSNTPPQWEQKASVSLFLFSTCRLSCAVQRNQQRQKISPLREKKAHVEKWNHFSETFIGCSAFYFPLQLCCVFTRSVKM